MNDEDTKKSWWQTLPGILTGITATITALAGLLVAVNQTGWFSHSKSESQAATPPTTLSPVQQTDTVTAQDAIRSNSAEIAASTTAAAPVVEAHSASTASSSNGGSVQLPTLRDYKFEAVVFTLLSASLEPRNTETSLLKLELRLLNTGNYPSNFWDSQFRIVMDGIPRAPTSGLNKIVAGNSAEEGEVTFVVPKSVTSAQLRILFHDEKTDVPLKFSQT